MISGKLCTNGRMTVPSEKLRADSSPWDVKYVNHKVVTRNMMPSEKDKVKKFMLKYFYQEASVPKALRLTETHPTYEYLEDELNLMLESSFNLVSIDQGIKIYYICFHPLLKIKN